MIATSLGSKVMDDFNPLFRCDRKYILRYKSACVNDQFRKQFIRERIVFVVSAVFWCTFFQLEVLKVPFQWWHHKPPWNFSQVELDVLEKLIKILSIIYISSWIHKYQHWRFWFTSVFKTVSNICDEAFFAKIVNSTQGLTISAKKLHYRCLKNPKYISRSQIFFKIVVHKNFANLIGKKVYWRLFLIKLQALSPAALFKRNFNTGVFLWSLRNFKNAFFYRTPPVAASWFRITKKYKLSKKV